METTSRTLSYGMFFGASEVHREIPGFSVSLLSPTFRAEDVPLHCHQNASFVLVLAGTYLSSADGADRISQPSTLFFNPAGTTHRDAFELPEGQFLAVSLSEQSRRIAGECAKLPTAATAFRRGEVVETAFRLARQCSQSESDSVSLGILEGLCWELLSNVAGRELWSEKVLPSWLWQAKELLRDQCSQPLLISGLARELGVHPVYLARTFRKGFGCTPGSIWRAADCARRWRFCETPVSPFRKSPSRQVFLIRAISQGLSGNISGWRHMPIERGLRRAD